MDATPGKTKGLQSSIWAQPHLRPYHDNPRFSTRARSYTPPPVASTNGLAASSSSSATTMTQLTTSAPARSGSTVLSPLQSFQRFEQACQRLRWKFIDLQSSYRRATNPDEAGFTVADAERNFKVDFHEFYVWIEQALVLVLRIFDVSVPRGDGGLRGSANHAYHHNVLAALDDQDCPLYAALGVGDVHHALWKAKELRNRWKDAAEGKETPPLKMYDLSWVVGQILGGLELAYGLAAVKVQEDMARAAAMGIEDDAGAHAQREGQDEGWDWMVETMDWES